MSQMDRRSFLVSSLVLGIDLPDGAATADEPAGRVTDVLGADRRLDKSVTLRVKRDPLSDVVSELRRQTGVRIEAAAGVADEPAIVFVSEQPARDVMGQIAALFDYTWRRYGASGAYRYELYQDADSRKEEERLRAEELRRLKEALRSQIDRYVRLSGRPAEELVKEAESLRAAVDTADLQRRRVPQEEQFAIQMTREWRERQAQMSAVQAMADPHQRALLRLVTALTPVQWDSLLQEEPLVYSSLREPGTLPLPKAIEQVLRAEPPAWRLPGDRPVPDIPQFEGQARFAEQLRVDWRRAIGFHVCLKARLREFIGPGSIGVGLKTSAVLPEKRQSATHGRDMRIGASMLRLEFPPPAEMSSEEAALDPVLAARRRLVLARKVDNSSDEWWSEWLTVVLAGLATSYSLNLVADGYRIFINPPPRDRSGEEMSLYDALNHYVLPGSRWRRDGEFVRVRRRRWHAVRLTEIPRRVERQWAGYLRARRSLTLDETAAWVLALTCGGILGGIVISRLGIKRCLWPMVLCLNIPNLFYVWAAFAKPGVGAVTALVAVDQFGYGFGFSAYMVYLMFVSQGSRYETSNYAIATGLMALGAMFAGIASGYLQQALGYTGFFVVVCLATIPGMITLFFIPLDREDIRRAPVEID